jgi:multicomponent Na+:H+ antiporter subunit B
MSERAAAEHARNEPHAAEDDWHRPWLAVGLVGAVGAAFAIGLVALPRESAALPAVARHAMQIALPKWGTTEVVSEIVYGSRGFDTFGETFLLLAAVIAVTTLGRGREARGEYVGEASAGMQEQSRIDPHGGDEDGTESEARGAEESEGATDEPLPDPDSVPLGEFAPERAEAMTVVVRVAARTAAVILAVAAVYLAAWGYTPGGGFPAGAAVAGVAILLYTALGRHAVRTVVRPAVLEPVEIGGALGIIVIGLLGLAFRQSLFANWATLAEQQTIRAGGNEQLYSGAELIEVATGLTIAIFTLLGTRHDWTPDEEDEGGNDDEGSS